MKTIISQMDESLFFDYHDLFFNIPLLEQKLHTKKLKKDDYQKLLEMLMILEQIYKNIQ